ncbi:SDR family oxidoreductase [Aestuariibacter halophilus]|uniref:SDR family oxidoreductase n=1 Tax=Fluctibacter halophilus TaxID=226011 RepID=A0ABS8GA79_9ALTE|nr:SDR family oxidoreductase [Aestuariibacter halophilus]MCC2616614.1 SDR family oxidoreductase [Aestuariibacter halophilus]
MIRKHKQQPVAVVTGGSRGIGAATAIALADAGYAVCIHYRNNDAAAQKTIAAIRDNNGHCIAVKGDIGVQSDVAALFTTASESLGPITAVVNNAAVLSTQTDMLGITAERLANTVQTNLMGTFYCCQQAVRHMSTRFGHSGGSIVNVSSLAARTGAPNEYIDYAASKGAVDTLTKGLAKEVAAQGIRVNGVRPAYIDTDMHADGGEPGRVARVAPTIPLQRGGTPQDVANAIVWLLSDKAAFINGELLDVAGGLP